jgi:uncharacterized protein (TIRG00374 family)
MAGTIRKLFKVFIPLVLGVVILYFLYRQTEFDKLWINIQKANWGILSFSLIFGLLGNVLRGLRWQLLIVPLGYRPPVSQLVYAVLGSYAVNFAIPRAGELWRCGTVSKKNGIPFAKLVGTVLVDRLFDIVMVGLFVLAAFACSSIPVFQKVSVKFDFPSWLTSPSLYLGLALGVAVSIFILIVFKNNTLVSKVRVFIISMGQGMLRLLKMEKKTQFLLYSLGIWIAYFLYFYITFFAFEFTSKLGFAVALVVFTLSSISMSVPSNGGLGPWQAAVVFGLVACGVNKDSAMVFATAVFAFQSIWLVMCGLFGITALFVGKGNSSTPTVR